MVHPDGLLLCYYGDDFTGSKLDADFHLMLCSFLGNRCIANAIYDGDGVGAVALVEAHLTYGKQILVAR